MLNEPDFEKNKLSSAIEGEFKPVKDEDDVYDFLGSSSTLNQSWEDLDDMYYKFAKGIITIGNAAHDALTHEDLVDELKNNREVKTLVLGLTSDLNNFTSELLNIHEKHIGKTGPIKDGDDLAISLSIFEDYVNFNTRFTTLTLAPMLNIMDQVTNAVSEVQYKRACENGEINQEDNDAN